MYIYGSVSAGREKWPFNVLFFFIGPESDHWQCLSITHSLTDSLTDSLPFSKLFDVSLACEDGNSKLVEVAFLDWNQIV